MDSLEENLFYALMGNYNLMLYPYITFVLRVHCDWMGREPTGKV